ncbi:hypothetical protein NPIL_406051 [Nephila pilipes]|uniref:Uncharacterized protein n=1 Tax=Nephila pilipes TaxID=299642 RepID=A0A8X6NMM1_NEPPI|nr:hypothetical protein NPIL_406051 [Nephila pilipes]
MLVTVQNERANFNRRETNVYLNVGLESLCDLRTETERDRYKTEMDEINSEIEIMQFRETGIEKMSVSLFLVQLREGALSNCRRGIQKKTRHVSATGRHSAGAQEPDDSSAGGYFKNRYRFGYKGG